MRYLRVTRWEDLQHYKNRRAPWIRAYTSDLDPVEAPLYAELTDGAKITLWHVRLLAGVTANEIPEVMLTRDRLNMKTPPKIDELVTAGFAEWTNGASAQDALPLAPPQIGASNGASAQYIDSLGSNTGENEASRKESKKPRNAKELIESFFVTETHRNWGASNAPLVDVDRETDDWRDHFRASGYRTNKGPVADADAAWRRWMRTAQRIAEERRRGSKGKPAAASFRPAARKHE